VEQVAGNWSPRTKALLVASPSNPTGTMLSGAQLNSLAASVASRGGRLIVDEIYHGLTYGFDAPTALQFSDDLFVINSFSKYFNMTGWRLGWIVAPEAFVKDIEKLAGNLSCCPSAPAQYAALAAFLPETIEILEARRQEFQARRDYLLPQLDRLGFKVKTNPQGAFYIYADCSGLTDDSFRFAGRLLEEAAVAITPGMDFGAFAPERHVRFAYTVSQKKLEEGVARIGAFLNG
jgi:aspartate/methionine/tyrosine aminotransferase